ncbi:MAG: VIT domain-containing protein, partial [Verrucomicrobiota bacterium]
MNLRTLVTGLCLGCALGAPVFGNGILIPKDGSLPPLAIKHQRVDIAIKDGVAQTRVEQVFKNHTDQVLEATYIFPVPKNASINDFAMYINGKRESGELVEKGKARKIYEDIVRRMKDPGLLEHIDDNLFKIRVYPIAKKGEQRIEMEYSEALPYDGGLYKLTYPLKTGEKASSTLEDFTVSARLKSSIPIKNIYSPTHKVGISWKGDHEAIIGFEEDAYMLNKDFELYYGVSKKDFGLNLLASSASKKDGYFMMMISPTVLPKEDMVIQKDVTFVF